MVHASVFAEPPLGVRRAADAAAPAKQVDDAAAPGQLWVQHVHFPTIKKTASTPESFRGMKRQTSSRVLHELRSAKRVVQDQLDDFRRKLLELDQWIAHGHTETPSGLDMSAVPAKRKTKRSHKRSHHAATEPLVSTPALAATSTVAAILPCKQPRTQGVIPPPPSDPNLGDMQAADDAPCTTAGCWQFLHDAGFFKPLSPLEVDRALEIEHRGVARVSSPLEPATDSDDGSTSSLASRDRHAPHDDKLSPPTECLTSRLLGALVEEGECDVASEMDGKPPEMTASASFDVDVNETNVFLRKELEAIGALDVDDDAAILVRDDDEVSVELRKCEEELARQVVVTNRLKSALYHAIQARAETTTLADDHATLKLYHKLQRKRQVAKRKRKQSSKQHKQQKRHV